MPIVEAEESFEPVPGKVQLREAGSQLGQGRAILLAIEEEE
jgi:hypothetical protein